MMRFAMPLVMLLFLSGCASKRKPFELLPNALRSPDGSLTPLGDTLAAFYNQREGWVELQPGMTLKLERAYFTSASISKRLENFVGLESALFRTGPRGTLERKELTLLPQRPKDQPSITAELAGEQIRLRQHRLYFQVALDKTSGKSNAVLLSASSRPRILEAKDVAQLCGAGRGKGKGKQSGAVSCKVFPEGSSVSLALDITLNGKVKNMLWGSTLGNAVGAAETFKLQRLYRGKWAEVKLDPRDPAARKLLLLPLDVIQY